MGFGPRALSRCVLVTVNVLTMIAGATLAIVSGLVASNIEEDWPVELQDTITATGISMSIIGWPLMVIGCIICMVSFVGCVGAWTQHRCLLWSYLVCLMVLIVIELAIAMFLIGGFEHLPFVGDEIDAAINSAVKDAWANDESRQTFVDTFGCDNEQSTAAMDACADKIKSEITNPMTTIGKVAIAIAGVELVLVFTTLWMLCSKKTTEKKRLKDQKSRSNRASGDSGATTTTIHTRSYQSYEYI